MTTSSPVEIELKLALPPGQVAAFLRRMARRRATPVVQQLITRYFDTPGFELAARGVALRVRRAGRRWLQTLKTEGQRQGGLSMRIEHEMPVAGDALDWARFPAEALGHVPEALRATVVPVFETRFTRTAWLVKGRGGAQIEIALDVGEVRAGERSQPLCEIELELKSGQPDALFALALDWAHAFDCVPFDVSKAERGTRLARGEAAAPVKAAPLELDSGMSVEEGFAATVQNCLAQFQANLPGVLGPLPHEGKGANAGPKPMASPPLPNPLMKPLSDRLSPQAGKSPLIPQVGEGANAGPKPINDSEYVHQARVALRRLRAALRLYRKACVLPAPLLDGLRTLAAALGPARDWDVLCEETLPAIAPHADAPVAWAAGMVALEAQRQNVHEAMRLALIAACPGAWLLAMQRWLLQHGWREAPEAQRFAQMGALADWARRALRRGQRPIVTGARAFATLAPAERHWLRIAIKRQRYAAEFFQSLLPARRQVPYLAALCALQDSLGRCNDAHVAAGLLQGTESGAGPMAAFARGWLAAVSAGCGSESTASDLQNFVKLHTCW